MAGTVAFLGRTDDNRTITLNGRCFLSFQLFSQNAGVAGRAPRGLLASARLRPESFQRAGHDTAGVRHVRHMHRRGPAGPGMEPRAGHDRILRGPPDQTDQSDVNEKMFELRAGEYVFPSPGFVN